MTEEPAGRHAYPAPPPGHGAGDDADGDDLLVRPFLVTGGRTTTSRVELRIETLVRSSPGATTGALRFEARRIVEISRDATSVAELSAALGQPLGVVRVLVGDLLDAGAVHVVEPQEISLSLLERIRDRVRAL